MDVWAWRTSLTSSWMGKVYWGLSGYFLFIEVSRCNKNPKLGPKVLKCLENSHIIPSKLPINNKNKNTCSSYDVDFRTARTENQQRIKILACRQPTGCRAQNLIFKETHKNSAWEASKCQSMPRPNVSMEYRWSLASSLQAWERNPESSKTTTVLQVWKTVRTLRAVSNRFVLWDWLVMFVTFVNLLGWIQAAVSHEMIWRHLRALRHDKSIMAAFVLKFL